MRSRIINWSLALVAVLLLPQVSKAQIAASNPLEWIALAEGNELINGQIEKQIKGQTQTALLQNSIAAEFNRIHEWQKQYNGYLKTVNGYASSLKACTHLYNDGVRIFLTLGKLGKAIKDNPQGIVASMGMNNLYTENMICKKTIALMKPSAILINTSRGKIINSQDLANALTTGKLGYAAIDVLEEEPPVHGSSLIENSRCLVTPHIAWAPLQARTRCMQIVEENIRAFKEGKPQNVINL